jgi:short-subunit dehydrogenase
MTGTPNGMAARPDGPNESVVVIVGASSGFGRGAALKLASEGASVVAVARRGPMLDELAEVIVSGGGTAVAVQADVSEAADVVHVADVAVDRFGRIDAWVNNVGVGAIGYFWDIPIEDHARLVDVNLKGLIHGAHAALRQFRAQGYGTLINTGSIDSETPLALQNTYAATKAAVLSLGRSLNEELRLAGEREIRVGTIMPWAVDTPWWVHAANYTGHAPRMAMMDDPQIVIDAIAAACFDPKEEQAVGWKAAASEVMHRFAPDLTERMSAVVARREADKAGHVPISRGALHEPMDDGQTVDGGIRERMAREDAAAADQ